MLKSKWADSLLGHYRSTNGIARLNACQAQTNIPLSCREIHEMSPKVWSVANNGYVRGFPGGGGSSLCHNTSLQRLSMVLSTGASPPTPAHYLLGLRYYLELENKHLGRVVPSWKLVRPQGSAESTQWRLISSCSYLYHATVETEDGFVHLIKSYMLLSRLLIDKYTFLRHSSWW